MLKHPFGFLFLNFFITALFLIPAGFSSIYAVMLLVSFIIIFSNFRTVGVINSIVLAIIYLLIFDSSFFSITILNIRLWYLFELPVLGFYLYKNFDVVEKKYKGVFFIPIFTLIFICLVFFVTDSMNGKLSIIKYLLFSVGLIYIVYNSILDILKKIDSETLFLFFVSLGLFVAIWGIFQYLTSSIPFVNMRIMYDYYNGQPSAFFSETTWYSEYIFFSLVILFYLYVEKKRDVYLLLMLPCLFGILISATRNSFLAIALWIFIEFYFFVKRGKINNNTLKIFITAFFLVLFVLLSFGLDKLILLNAVVGRFSNGDSGRMEAFRKSFEKIQEALIFGQGFNFDPNIDVAGAGSYIGAKCFNFFLMILHISGLFGFIIFSFLGICFLKKLVDQVYLFDFMESRIACVFFSCFLAMSMFAPIHQYPFGMFIVGVSVALYKYCEQKSEIYIKVEDYKFLC